MNASVVAVLSIADSAACALAVAVAVAVVVVACSVVFAVITDAVASADVVKCIAVDFIAVMIVAFIAGRFEIANVAALLVADVVVFIVCIAATTATVEAATFRSTFPAVAVLVLRSFVSFSSLRILSTCSFIVGITAVLLLAFKQLCAHIASGLAAAIETNVTLALAGGAGCFVALLLLPFVVRGNLLLLLLVLMSSSSLSSLSFWPKNATSAV